VRGKGRGIGELEALFAPVYGRTIVTGGGSGIGRAVALSLARLGNTVYIMGRTRSKLDETALLAEGTAGRIVAVVYDMTDPTSVASAFAFIAADGGPAQALVHAASDATPCLGEEISIELFRHTVAAVLEGTFSTVQTWARALIASELPGVAVCYTSSTSSRETPGLSHSSAAKNGVQSMIRSWAREWGRFGLRLSMIGPGFFPEPDMHHTAALNVDKTRRRLLERIALGRQGEMHEIVGPAVWLLSRSGTYMTGEGFSVDGGIHLLDWTRAPGDA